MGIFVLQLRFVALLPGEPEEERLEGGKGRVNRWLAQLLAGAGVELFGEVRLEGNRLFAMEAFEVLATGVVFETVQRLGNGNDRNRSTAAPV